MKTAAAAALLTALFAATPALAAPSADAVVASARAERTSLSARFAALKANKPTAIAAPALPGWSQVVVAVPTPRAVMAPKIAVAVDCPSVANPWKSVDLGCEVLTAAQPAASALVTAAR